MNTELTGRSIIGFQRGSKSDKTFNAPNPAAASQAARQEIDDMISLCDHPPGTLLAIERSISGNDISEKTHVLTPPDEPAHAKIWTLVEDG